MSSSEISDINTSEYWSQRYSAGDTPWDIGGSSTPISAYFQQVINKSLKILIPGCGNAHEAEQLFSMGFTNVHLLDISKDPIENFLKRNSGFPKAQAHVGDFFKHMGEYDIIVEQTFFCALPPELREDYVQKAHQLLKPKGKLIGLLFNDKLNADKPPFGGSKDEYQRLFEPYYDFKIFETSYNSIKPREGRELFINLTKK